MYLRILKKDLKRKKTMNIILLIFIALAVMFIAGSVNNMLAVARALDTYFEKAQAPDYWFCVNDKSQLERFGFFAAEEGYEYRCAELLQVGVENVTVSNEELDYDQTLFLSKLNNGKDVRVFDQNSKQLTDIHDGEIYVSSPFFSSDKNDFYEGCKIVISVGDVKKEFVLKGTVKDVLFGSEMVGMSRFFISDHDFDEFLGTSPVSYQSVLVYTDDAHYQEKFNKLELPVVMNVDNSMIRKMYLMDMLIAAIVLVVSICLILISMVILHFTIHFTVSEEFREIGVMKAIGITETKIRGLYLIKYFAVSVLGAAIGFGLSFPFGSLLIGVVSKNMIIESGAGGLLNGVCAVSAAAAVVLFGYFCMGEIRKFSPIDAIRNGESGERYARKGFIHLTDILCPIPFMALNDILSGLKRFASMFLIFTLGTLLIIIPVNAINTLSSDGLLVLFSMAPSDIVIGEDDLIGSGKEGKDGICRKMDEVREKLAENGIEADVFEEIFFRKSISRGDKKMSSMAFYGVGDVEPDQYSYMEGTAPQNKNEIAISHVVADHIDAGIGDDVEINQDGTVKIYTVTAIYQSMNNFGEGIRFCQDGELDYNTMVGRFGIQIRYTDNPDRKTLADRKELIKKLYPDKDIYTPGEYVGYMTGSPAEQLEGVKNMILGIVICINMLVAVLMVKSFLAKERGEIAILKAIGFQNSCLVRWQTMRIGLVLLASVIAGMLLQSPVSGLTVTPVFRMMGAYSITYDIREAEVYVIYPLLVLAATTLSAFISAQGIRKIAASESSNIE